MGFTPANGSSSEVMDYTWCFVVCCNFKNKPGGRISVTVVWSVYKVGTLDISDLFDQIVTVPDLGPSHTNWQLFLVLRGWSFQYLKIKQTDMVKKNTGEDTFNYCPPPLVTLCLLLLAPPPLCLCLPAQLLFLFSQSEAGATHSLNLIIHHHSWQCMSPPWRFK